MGEEGEFATTERATLPLEGTAARGEGESPLDALMGEEGEDAASRWTEWSFLRWRRRLPQQQQLFPIVNIQPNAKNTN